MIADMTNSEEPLISQTEQNIEPSIINALNRANKDGELVLSLPHYETLKRARKRLLSKEPICFLKSDNPLIVAHYKKLLTKYISNRKERSVVYYKGGSVDAMLSVMNMSMKSYSMDKVLGQKNSILARDKLILVVEREEDLVEDEWALLELFKSDLRFGPMGIIASTSSNVRDDDIKRVPQEFLFEFGELSEQEFDILDRVDIPQRISHGYEYIQMRKEGATNEKLTDKDVGSLIQHETSSAESLASRLLDVLSIDELSMLVFFTLLILEIFYFAGRQGVFG
jgi:hypothetical protein